MKPYILLLLLLIGCQTYNHRPRKASISNSDNSISFLIIPLGNISNSVVDHIFNNLKNIIPNTKVLTREPLPGSAYNSARNRYRADSLIAWLGRRANQNEVYIGVTTTDISTTNKERGVNDWGVMGLGFCPGNACVISNYRLKDKSPKNVFKVVIHEVGHTSGLSHCPIKTCYMRDAKGGDHTSEETGFCNKCLAFLTSKGWNI